MLWQKSPEQFHLRNHAPHCIQRTNGKWLQNLKMDSQLLMIAQNPAAQLLLTSQVKWPFYLHITWDRRGFLSGNKTKLLLLGLVHFYRKLCFDKSCKNSIIFPIKIINISFYFFFFFKIFFSLLYFFLVLISGGRDLGSFVSYLCIILGRLASNSGFLAMNPSSIFNYLLFWSSQILTITHVPIIRCFKRKVCWCSRTSVYPSSYWPQKRQLFSICFFWHTSFSVSFVSEIREFFLKKFAAFKRAY